MSKSDKAKELGIERASNRMLKYLDKIRWRDYGIEAFNEKVFNQTNKRNTKDYFVQLSQLYEKFFRIALKKYEDTLPSYSHEKRDLFEEFRQVIRDLVNPEVESIEEEE